MTALLVYVRGEIITAYADGVTYDAEGVYRRPATKCLIAPHLPGLLLSTGSAHTCEFAKIMMMNRGSFDEVIDRAREDLMKAVAEGHIAAGEPINAGVTIGGWSERHNRVALYEIWANGSSPGDLQDGSFQVTEIEPGMLHVRGPKPSEDALREAGLLKDDGLHLHTDAAAIAFMEAQRRTKAPTGPGEPEGYTVGVHIQKTVWERRGGSTEIIHRWPDKIGQKLSP